MKPSREGDTPSNKKKLSKLLWDQLFHQQRCELGAADGEPLPLLVDGEAAGRRDLRHVVARVGRRRRGPLRALPLPRRGRLRRLHH